MRTCPGPGSGISTSAISNFAFAAGMRAIFIVATSGTLPQAVGVCRADENSSSSPQRLRRIVVSLPLLFYGQPLVDGDPEGVCLAEFGIAASTDPRLDPLDELAF